MMCSNTENGCDWVGELRSLDDHLTTCGYALLRCTNQCMDNTEEVWILRHDLDHHLKDKCPNRQYQCPHCKDTGRYCDITTTHLDICPKLKVSCPNDGCKASVPRCDLVNHRSKCQYEEVLCKYAAIGCGKELLRKDLEQHEIDATFHLPLAIETVNKQQQEINELKAFKEEQKVMTDSIMACQSGPFVFKMPEYHQHKSSNKEWYSPPFYSHPGGYKVCIKVFADGHGEGAGTHVSVYAYLMKGRNDDNLTWPFTGKVTITLLNQLADENHHTSVVLFPPDMDTESNRRVVEGERSLGLGHPAYIAYDELDFDTTKNCQYLNDDSLYFKIEVQTTKGMKPWLTCTV